MKRLLTILCAALGFVAIGALLGTRWLDQRLDSARWRKPTVQFVTHEHGDRAERSLLPRLVGERSRDDEDEATKHVLRIAEIHALIEAEVASEELQQLFCTETELVPAEVLDRIVEKHPALIATIEVVCRVDVPADAGAEE